ncbi:MAG: LysR substrate-binding domain-containing protein [bacterium]|nr:LysR substrate-binding domain-containing protein [bacterium]
MTLRHLRIFVAVYQTCSITRAAENLHLSQPSVTLAIQELEHYYGIELFARIGRRLLLTDHAHSFYRYSSHIISLYDEMEQSVKNADASGTLRVGASVTAGNDGFTALIRRFQSLHPTFRIEVKIHNYQQIEKAILENQIDLALIEGNSTHPQLISQPYKENLMVFVAAPNYASLPCLKEQFKTAQDTTSPPTKKQLSVRDLESCDFILRESGSACRSLFDSLMLLYDMEGNILWESSSTEAILSAVREGFGISLLSSRLVQKEVSNGSLMILPIQEPLLSRNFSILYHKNKYMTPAVKDFIKLCQEGAT